MLSFRLYNVIDLKLFKENKNNKIKFQESIEFNELSTSNNSEGLKRTQHDNHISIIFVALFLLSFIFFQKQFNWHYFSALNTYEIIFAQPHCGYNTKLCRNFLVFHFIIYFGSKFTGTEMDKKKKIRNYIVSPLRVCLCFALLLQFSVEYTYFYIY